MFCESTFTIFVFQSDTRLVGSVGGELDVHTDVDRFEPQEGDGQERQPRWILNTRHCFALFLGVILFQQIKYLRTVPKFNQQDCSTTWACFSIRHNRRVTRRTVRAARLVYCRVSYKLQALSASLHLDCRYCPSSCQCHLIFSALLAIFHSYFRTSIMFLNTATHIALLLDALRPRTWVNTFL